MGMGSLSRHPALSPMSWLPEHLVAPKASEGVATRRAECLPVCLVSAGPSLVLGKVLRGCQEVGKTQVGPVWVGHRTWVPAGAPRPPACPSQP